MATVDAADFPPRKATILEKPVELVYSGSNDEILKILGLQGVLPEDKQKIMKEFYVTPPDSTHTLSLQGYPATQAIVKSLLIDLIQEQQNKIKINKEAAVRDTSIPVAYHKKARGISLSIQLPPYLVNHTSGLRIEAKQLRKGVTKSTTRVMPSGSTGLSGSTSLSGSTGLSDSTGLSGNAGLSGNVGKLASNGSDDAEQKYAEIPENQQERTSKIGRWLGCYLGSF